MSRSIRPWHRLRLVPVREPDGRWFATAYDFQGRVVWSTNIYDTEEESLSALERWAALQGWDKSKLLRWE